MQTDRLDTTLVDTLRALPENPAVGFAVCDLQCVIQHANPAFTSLFGLDAGAGKGQPLLRLASPHALDSILYNLRRACAGEARAFIFHGRYPRTLKTFAVLMAALPLADVDCSEAVACLAFALTGTADGDALSLLDSLGEAAAILNQHGDVLWTNPAFFRVTGYDMSGLLPTALPFLAVGSNLLDRALSELNRNGLWQGEVRGNNPDGTMLVLLASISPMPGTPDEIPRWLLLCSDVTHHFDRVKELERVIRHDPLTGLLNRDAFRERVANAIYRCRDAASQMAVLFLDLDGFKAINDNYGHVAGDSLLAAFGKRLRTLARETTKGVDIARLGGDEFAVLIPPQTDALRQTEVMCQNVLALFDAPFQVEEQSHWLSASIGGCLGPGGHATASDILHSADQAMYAVKRGGSGLRFFIQPIQPEE